MWSKEKQNLLLFNFLLVLDILRWTLDMFYNATGSKTYMLKNKFFSYESLWSSVSRLDDRMDFKRIWNVWKKENRELQRKMLFCVELQNRNTLMTGVVCLVVGIFNWFLNAKNREYLTHCIHKLSRLQQIVFSLHFPFPLAYFYF